jgi:DNA invertase Pin-like site-specific DNA recombinase
METTPIRAACYCRISSDPKDKREGVDRQREDTAALCELKGWQVAGFYIDNDRSASNGKGRPEWERLLADVEAGKIDAVAAWDQDRINRMMDDFQRYKKLFVKHGILLAASNVGDIDLTTPTGVLTATIKTAVSEHEVSMMKIRMRRAGHMRAERGTPWWRDAFGYTPGYELHPVEAELVRKGYESILGGGSLSGIAREWNAAGAHGRNGKPWSATTVSGFLRSPRNAGLRSHTRDGITTIIGAATWPALVDETTWRATQAILEDPARRPGPKTVRRYFLTGLLRCGKCKDGGAMAGHQGARGQLRYRCTKCHGSTILKADAENLIVDIVCARLARPDAKALLIDRDAPDLDKLGAEANAIRARRDELAAELADDTITPAEWRTIRERLNAKLAAVEEKMADASAARVFADVPLGTHKVRAAFDRLDMDRQRAVINVMLTATVMPAHKRGRHTFDPERVVIEWRR